MEKLFLKDTVVFEPLVNGWYAWPYLIPPVTFARFLKNTHLRLMKSFVSNHELHMLAASEPGLVGGEFVACVEDDIDGVSALIANTEESCGDVLSLNQAVHELDAALRDHISGESIEYLYAKVPQVLQGFVELFLDSEHHAGFRLLEPLLYRSGLYKQNLQTACFYENLDNADRSFVFSTPRIARPENLLLELPFACEDLDLILASRELGIAKSELLRIQEQYPNSGGVDLLSLFANESSQAPKQSLEDITIEYTGHAGFLIRSPKLTIMIDPLISIDSKDGESECMTYRDLPSQIDYVLLTHSHADHFNLESLLQLRYKIGSVVVPRNNGGTLFDPSMKYMLKELGFKVIEMDDLEQVVDGEITFTSIPFIGEHGDLNIRSKTAWVIELMGKKIYFGADSANPEPMLFKKIHALVGDIDLLCIGMECVGAPYTWSYGALHTAKVPKAVKESRRLNGSDSLQASEIVKALRPSAVVIYALGLELCFKYLMGIEYDDDSTQIKEADQFVKIFSEDSISFEMLNGKRVFELDASIV